MNVRELKAFILLADELHFSRAADTLHMSTSTLTRVVQRLEESVGAPLFQRDNRDVALTREGHLFLSFARETVKNWNALLADCSDQNQVSGKLSLYCTVTAAHLFLSSMIHKFRQTFPLVKLALETGDVEDAYKKVERQQADIAFAIRENSLNNKFHFQSVTHIPLVLIAPRQPQKWLPEKTSSSMNWSQIPFIMPESAPARKNVQEWFKSMQVKPKVYARVSGHEAMVSLVALGCGVSIVPLPVWQNSPVKHLVSQIQTSVLPQPFELGLVCLEKHRLTPAVKAFYSLMIEDF